MVFVHPNPMDRSSWLYQVVRFSTWFRCIAVDLPGYGRSPTAGPGLTIADVAEGVWECVDRLASSPEGAVLVGCSIGSAVTQHMYHRRPQQTAALVVCGTGWWPEKEFARRHVTAYRRQGLDYRQAFTLNGFSPEFRQGPLAHWFASLFMERNATADLDSIIMLLEAHGEPDPDWLQADLRAPVLIVSGSQDPSHEAAFRLRDRLPRAELVVLEGAGHACHIEQPLAFDAEVIRFLSDLGIRSSPRP